MHLLSSFILLGFHQFSAFKLEYVERNVLIFYVQPFYSDYYFPLDLSWIIYLYCMRYGFLLRLLSSTVLISPILTWDLMTEVTKLLCLQSSSPLNCASLSELYLVHQHSVIYASVYLLVFFPQIHYIRAVGFSLILSDRPLLCKLY